MYTGGIAPINLRLVSRRKAPFNLLGFLPTGAGANTHYDGLHSTKDGTIEAGVNEEVYM